MKKLIIVPVLLAFISLGIYSVHHQQQLNNNVDIQLDQKEIRIKTLQQKMLEIDKQLDQQKGTSEQDKQKIEQLQKEKEQLEKDLQAKLERQEQERLAKLKLEEANKKATLTQTAHASGGCGTVREYLAGRGFSSVEINAGVELARLESGCNSNARNRGSGACSYYQELPCGKWGGTSNPNAHLNGAVAYMQGRYGSWQNALNTWHNRSPHWW